jgi:hypothetical protein
MEGFVTAPSGITPSMTNRHKGNQEFTRERHHHALANAAASRADALTEPDYLRGTRLVALPKPGQTITVLSRRLAAIEEVVVKLTMNRPRRKALKVPT